MSHLPIQGNPDEAGSYSESTGNIPSVAGPTSSLDHNKLSPESRAPDISGIDPHGPGRRYPRHRTAYERENSEVRGIRASA